MKANKHILFAVLTTLIFLTTGVYAAILEVGPGKPYTTIQAAIDAANDGDTVLVYDGTYVENIQFLRQSDHVKSINGAASTIIDGTVNIGMGTSFNTIFDGFTISFGASCILGAATITNCIISGNTGVGLYYGAAGTNITNCIISANGGDGIVCAWSSATITNSTISGNGGSGIRCSSDSNAEINNCIISNNAGGGVQCAAVSNFASYVVINNSIITDNTATYGGGISHLAQESLILSSPVTLPPMVAEFALWNTAEAGSSATALLLEILLPMAAGFTVPLTPPPQ